MIQQRYSTGRELGSGSLWTVFEGRDLTSGQAIALKLMNPRIALETEVSERILKQAEETLRLIHPNIARVWAVGIDGDIPFLVQELVDGRTIRQWFMEEGRSFHELREKLAIILSTVAAAHEKGILHRGLKPGNILITTSGEVKITDFAQAARLETATQTGSSTEAAAAASYFSPEQTRGQRGDARSDLYSLGVLLYELSTGRLPFGGNDPVKVVNRQLHGHTVRPRQINPKVPQWLEALVLKLLQKDPEQRYQSAAQVLSELAKAPAEPRSGLVPLESRGRSTSPQAPLVNRKKEKGILQERLDEALQGRGSFLLLVGGVGTGKTRLAEELAAAARQAGMVSLRGPASDPHGLPLLSPFAEAALEYLRKTGQQLRERVAPEHAATIDALLEDDLLAPALTGRSLRSMQDYVRSFGDFLDGVAGKEGLMLILDDAGTLDEASLFLLRELVPSLAARRFLIVATCVPASVSGEERFAICTRAWESDGVLQRVKLTGLSRQSTDALVRQVSGATLVAADVAGLLFDKSQGNPLLIEELLQMCLRDHIVEVHEGTLRGRSPRGIEALLAVDDLLTYRIRNLPEKVAGVLSIASCIGCAFDFQILNQVAGMESDELVSVLKWSARSGLIEEEWSQGRERFRFTHDALHARLYSLLEPRGRKRMHLLIGGAIEELFEPRLPRFYASLVWHYRQSGQWKKAMEFAVLAAEFYTLLGLKETATGYYQEANGFAVRGHEPEAVRAELAGRAMASGAGPIRTKKASQPRTRKGP